MLFKTGKHVKASLGKTILSTVAILSLIAVSTVFSLNSASAAITEE